MRISQHRTSARSQRAARRDRRNRVLLVGQFGCGNLGNEASIKVVLDSLDGDQRIQSASLCEDPNWVTATYGIPAASLRWDSSGVRWLPSKATKILAKGVDVVRVFGQVRSCRAVLIPGTGVFEELGVVPWGLPYVHLLTAAAGKVFRVPVLFLDVGAEPIARSTTRRIMHMTAKLSTHISFRDDFSRSSMVADGSDVRTAPIGADLVFGVPGPEPDPVDSSSLVVVGVMAYYGMPDRPDTGLPVHLKYVSQMAEFLEHLVRTQFSVRLVTGDRKDEQTAAEIKDAALARLGPLADPDQLELCFASDLAGLAQYMSPARVVLATRYHNLVCALKLAKPTMSLGYGEKNAELLRMFELGDYAQHIEKFEVELLIEQFERLNAEADTRVASIRRTARLAESVVSSQLKGLRAFLIHPGNLSLLSVHVRGFGQDSDRDASGAALMDSATGIGEGVR